MIVSEFHAKRVARATHSGKSTRSISACYSSDMATSYTKWSMAIREMRKRRLKQLIDERFNGSLADAARGGIGRSATQLGSLLAGRRGIGEELARGIVCNLRLPLGYLDSDLRISATLVPDGVSERLERLYVAAAAGHISWDTLNAALDGAISVAASLPVPAPKLLPKPRDSH